GAAGRAARGASVQRVPPCRSLLPFRRGRETPCSCSRPPPKGATIEPALATGPASGGRGRKDATMGPTSWRPKRREGTRMEDQLREIERKFDELSELLSDPVVLADQDRLMKYAKHRSALEDTVTKYHEWQEASRQLED